MFIKILNCIMLLVLLLDAFSNLKFYRNILASANAEKRVQIWDVVAGRCDITMEHHSDKILMKFCISSVLVLQKRVCKILKVSRDCTFEVLNCDRS